MGKLVVLDGADGAGKDTQADQLLEKAKARGISVALIRYPAYEQTLSGNMVRQYLQGKFGEDIHPKVVSYLFALDRYEMKSRLKELLAQHDLVIASRYVVSNLVYQSARLPEEERDDFRAWLTQLEYEILGAPLEDAVIFLSLSVDLSDELIAKRKKLTETARDIYDENRPFRREVLGQYQLLCDSNDNWYEVNCEQDGQIRSIADIAAELDELVFKQILAPAEVA